MTVTLKMTVIFLSLHLRTRIDHFLRCAVGKLCKVFYFFNPKNERVKRRTTVAIATASFASSRVGAFPG